MPKSLDRRAPVEDAGTSVTPKTPLAVVGIGCRFPGGGNGPVRFWQLLCDGGDAIRDVPRERWSPDIFYDPHPGTPARTYAARGGFVDGVDLFDPEFFGISRREAQFIDPQQRMLLEVAWEAMEDAGVPLDRVRGTRCGVFVGQSNTEYGNIDATPAGLFRSDTYCNTGAAMSISANRISYIFDLHGPSIAVDTACSSALVAVHAACQSIWNGESSWALAGGVNALLLPQAWVGMSRLAMLSPDGKCKAFDASANGFVRAEGAGLVLLKPLPEALRDGDRIYAAILVTASNQDGHTTGMTVPSEEAQAELVRIACRQAGISPRDVRYVEAHGTGTLVGDPIECRALGSVLGFGRSESDPLWIGSVKSNIGHLESAAGIAGLIKAALVVYHRQMPANLHFREPNPEIPFAELRLKVPTELTPLPDGPAVAGVNSFGFGGTNAHVILREFRPQESAEPSQNGRPVELTAPRLIPLSARSAEALKGAARSHADWLAEHSGASEWDDFCYTLALRRTHHAHRLAVVARTAEEARASLLEFAEKGTSAKVAAGRIAGDASPQMAFVFSGQGTQYCGMVRDLLAHEPVFREAIEQCDELLRKIADWSLLEELARNEATTRLDETAIAQPAIFAVQVALARLWQSWGIEPSAAVGHSVGEAAAAYVSGIVSLDDAVRIIYHRGRCMDVPEARGRMLAVGLPLDDVRKLIADRGEAISIAAINSPSTITLSGAGELLEGIATLLEQRGVFHTFLKVQYAFHNPCIDGKRDDFLSSIAGIEVRNGDIPFYSGVWGRATPGLELTPEYWWDSIRHTVQFSEAVSAMITDGFHTFVELAAHGVLLGPVLETADALGAKVSMVHALRKDADERESILKCAGSLFVKGAGLEWTELAPKGRLISLPTYPWQRERFWNETDESSEPRIGRHYHRLLGHRLTSASPLWENHIDLRVQRYLQDHCVQGHPVAPAAGFLEMAAAAARSELGTSGCILDEVDVLKACFLRNEQTLHVQTAVNPAESSFRILSKPLYSPQEWTEHVTGRFRALTTADGRHRADLAALRERLGERRTAQECYRDFHELGLDYGPAFQCLAGVSVGRDEALGEIRASEALLPFLAGHHLHPALLDACLQTVISLVPQNAVVQSGARGIYLPVEFRQVRVLGPMPPTAWAHARLVERDSREIVADITVYDEAGASVVEIFGLRCRAVEGAPGQSAADVSDWVFEYRWKPQALESKSAPVSQLPRPADLVPQVREGFAQRYRGMPVDDYILKKVEEQWALCVEWILRGLAYLGLDVRPGGRFRVDDLVGRHGVLDRYGKLVRRHLALLETSGAVRKIDDEGRFEFVRGPDPEFPTWRRRFWWSHADSYADLTLLHRIGENLGPVLRGEIDPLSLVFPDGNMSVAEWYYQDSSATRAQNTRLELAVTALARRWPAGRPLRILEAGAGTGAFTAYVLPELARCPCEVHYTFTDLSDAFLIKAKDRLHEFPFVKYAKLDLERDPTTQGYERHSFDVIVASQVLHATADLSVTAAHLRDLLAPDGLLAFAEVVARDPIPLLDIVFGTLEGWWRFTDRDRRPDYPTMTTDRWRTLLEEAGFTDFAEASGEPDEKLVCGVLMARAPEASAETPASSPTSDAAAEPAASAASGRWLVFADQGGIGSRVAERLAAAGSSVVMVTRGVENRRLDETHWELAPGDAHAVQQLMNDVYSSNAAPLKGVLHFWSCDAGLETDSDLGVVTESLAPSCLTGMHILQALAELNPAINPRVWLVTKGSHAVHGEPPAPQPLQGALWGFARSAMNELAAYRPTLVDLSLAPSDEEIEGFVAELAADRNEEEIALRGASRYVHRLIHTRGHRPAPKPTGQAAARLRYRLETARQGTLDQLVLRQQPVPTLDAGQVEVEVEASALNFSDVMKALGLYPGLPDGPVPMGLEFAGRIARVGPDVTKWRPGDAVLGLAPFSFGSHVVTDGRYIARMPAGMTFEQAATLPVAYLTAYYALVHLGRMRRGERVLIHAATGGVGLAAIQLARLAGAEVFATAGTPEKRDLLRWLGVEHVMDSRSLSFADEVLAATNGEGVDLVLNSLSGQAIQKSFGLLRDYGRFLEIGKRDIYADSRLGMRPFRRNLSFHAIDLDGAMRHRREMIGEVFGELARQIENGQLSVIPYRPFRISTISSAFRYMAQAKHIGKVVISHAESDLPILAATETRYHFRPDVTYLITGGLGGLGLAVASGMVRDGARRLVLMQRSGLTADTAATVDQLRAQGAEIVIEQGDVTQPDQLAGVLSRIAQSGVPLAGVMHLAMVLDDGLIVGLNNERFERAWAPKVLGAWNLHRQTSHVPLDFFVCFSSISSLVGMEGQANYAAANAFLDTLAAYRRSQGLPALTINWGYLGEVGWVARHPEIARRFESLGMKGIKPAEVMSLMGRFINDGSVQVGVVGSGAREFVNLVAGQTPRFEDLGKDDADENRTRGGSGSARAALMAAPPEQRRDLLESLLKDQISRVLGTTPDRLEAARPLTEMGLDSLVAVELKNWTEGELGLQLPTVELLRGPSIAQLIDLLHQQLDPAQAARPAAPTPTVNVDELSDAEVEAMLDSLSPETTPVASN